MNGINGMETARKIRLWDTSCHIIFVTTSSDFAVDSYEVKATYYLIKPTTEEQVSKALDRCNLQMMMNEASILVPAKKYGDPVIASSDFIYRIPQQAGTGAS